MLGVRRIREKQKYELCSTRITYVVVWGKINTVSPSIVDGDEQGRKDKKQFVLGANSRN